MNIRNKIINLFEAHDLFDIQGSPRNPNMWHSYPSTDYAMIEDNSKPNMFIDMDGVIVDFERGFKEKVGISPNEYEKEMGKDEFWVLVKSWGEEFWANLPWMPDGKELWSYISKHDPIILSAAMAGYQIRGKTEWLKKEVGYTDTPITNPLAWEGQSKITYHKDKYRFILKPGDVLIDDTVKKINDWNNHGGKGILHTSANQTIFQLKEIGL
jgi:hypothetical protein